MSLLGTENIKLLKKLFASGEDDGSGSEAEDNDPAPGGAHTMGPGDIGQNNSKPKKSASEVPGEHIKKCTYAAAEDSASKEPRSLDEWERQQEKQREALLESRPRPDYKISYKQTVATEDLYLQMSGKTPSTASCEAMVVEIFLTGETVGIHHIDLTVEEQRIVVQSPKYHLNLQLPHKVDPDKGNAAWFSDEKILKLTLTMVREFDFVNF